MKEFLVFAGIILAIAIIDFCNIKGYILYGV